MHTLEPVGDQAPAVPQGARSWHGHGRPWHHGHELILETHPKHLPEPRPLPSGELTFCHGKSPFLMGKFTISMAIFNCYVSSPEGKMS